MTDLLKNETTILENALRNILPSAEVDNVSVNKYTEQYISNYLRRFFLFSLNEITLPNKEDNISEIINNKYLNILAASYKSGLTVATVLNGHKGKVNVYLGFLTDNNVPPYVFQKIMQGVFPGSQLPLKEEVNIEKLLENRNFGALISGLPSLKVDNEKQNFNLASIVRSMYGENYTLLIISKPIPMPEVGFKFQKLLEIRDTCHSLARSNIGNEKSYQNSMSKNYETSESISNIKGTSNTLGISGSISNPLDVVKSFGVTAGLTAFGFASLGLTAGMSILPMIATLGVNSSRTWSNSQTNTKGWSEGNTSGTSEGWSSSLSFEQQNGLALEMEKMSENLIERIKKGLNVGFWETTISLATETIYGRDILGGSFLGELARPTTDNFPAKLSFSEINPQKPALIPKEDSLSILFPKSLCSYLSSDELSLIASPPIEALPGYEIKKMPPLSLTDPDSDNKYESFKLGYISDHGYKLEESNFNLSIKDLSKHIFICGITGSGKTTSAKQILTKANVPFLVLESVKRDYRQLLAEPEFKNKLRVYTIGDATISPIQINPFYILPGVSPLTHIDFLKAIFNASFSLYGPMPHILERCLHNIYIKRGWNLTRGEHPFFLTDGELNENKYKEAEHYFCFPTLNDLKNEINEYVKTKMDYKGELSDNIRTAIIARMDSLSVGAKGLMFNTYQTLNIEELLQNPVIFEMESLSDDDDKAFFVGLIITLITEYRQSHNPSLDPFSTENNLLKHILVIEEAHRLLKNVETERVSDMMGNPKGKAVEAFCNMISEMRSYGQGVIVIEQIPTKISPDVIKNTNTKIVHRLVSKDDQYLLSGSLNLDEKDCIYLTRLKTSYCLCHKEGMEKPVEVIVSSGKYGLKIANKTVSTLMSRYISKSVKFNLESNELNLVLGKEGYSLAISFFNSLITNDSLDFKFAINKVLKEMKIICLKENFGNYFDEETAKYLLLNKLTEIFFNGMYSINFKSLEGLISVLESLILENNISKIKILKNKLENYWNVSDCNLFIEQIISNILIKSIFSQTLSILELNKAVENFFLISDKSFFTKIELLVRKELGDI